MQELIILQSQLQTGSVLKFEMLSLIADCLLGQAWPERFFSDKKLSTEWPKSYWKIRSRFGWVFGAFYDN